MPRPAGWQPYRTADGAEVPSVTTVIGNRIDPGGITHAAWKLGKQGLDYRDVWRSRADAGTLTHRRVEAALRGHDWTPPEGVDPEMLARSDQAFANYQRQATKLGFRPVYVEQRLVSEALRVGGTVDVIGVDEQTEIIDWKSAKAIYPDMVVQVVAYGMIWEELHPDHPVAGYHVYRFSQDHGDMDHKHLTGDVEIFKRAFIRMRELYDLDRQMKARVR